jgi:hypothetical protein
VTERWVLNASPLIVLARVGQEHLFHTLADEVVVPRAVAVEIEAGPADDPARQFIAGGYFAIVEAVPVPEVLAWDLGAGETAVLSYALRKPEWTVILDDAAAQVRAESRAAAQRHPGGGHPGQTTRVDSLCHRRSASHPRPGTSPASEAATLMTRPSRRHTLDLISEGHFTYHLHNPHPALRRTLSARLSGCVCGWSSAEDTNAPSSSPRVRTMSRRQCCWSASGRSERERGKESRHAKCACRERRR